MKDAESPEVSGLRPGPQAHRDSLTGPGRSAWGTGDCGACPAADQHCCRSPRRLARTPERCCGHLEFSLDYTIPKLDHLWKPPSLGFLAALSQSLSLMTFQHLGALCLLPQGSAPRGQHPLRGQPLCGSQFPMSKLIHCDSPPSSLICPHPDNGTCVGERCTH